MLISLQRFIFCLLLTLVTASVYAVSDPEDVFNRLRNSGEDYTNTGAICEQVARLDLQERYPAPAYQVLTGILYKDHTRTIGELDVVVFRNSDRMAVVVAEVKCWRNLESAKKKAMEQRLRFQNTLESGKPIAMHLVKDPTISYLPKQFIDHPTYLAISQEGGVDQGFEEDLNFSLAELMHLRERLLDCQKNGACKNAR